MKKPILAGCLLLAAAITNPTQEIFYAAKANDLARVEDPVGKDTLSTDESTVKDIDGNVYRTVKISSQVWMAENLKTTRLTDGTPIAYIPGSAQWKASMPPAYCWVDNDSSNRDRYGAMYNWYAVNTGKLAPAGWRVPSEEDFKILIDHLGGKSSAWDGLNNVGFTAQGAGQFVVPECVFNFVSALDKYWTTTTGGHHPADAKYLTLTRIVFGDKIVNFSSHPKYTGKSVRCIKIN